MIFGVVSMDSSLKIQGYIFLSTVYGGLMIGLIYDLYKVIRYFLKPKKFATYIEDLFFWIIAALVIFNILLKSNWGELRGYVFLGFFIGILLYLKILEKVVFKILFFIFGSLIKGFKKVFSIIFYPVIILKRKLKLRTKKVKNIRHIFNRMVKDVGKYKDIISKKK